ncbi:MAG: putative HNHc nuclease [Massiliimalia sp.]
MTELPLKGAKLQNGNLIIPLNLEISRKVEQKILLPKSLMMEDGRTITDKQRKKIYAMLSDIALWTGYDKPYTKELFKDEFCFANDLHPFSLSTVDRTTAREFISYLILFAVYHNIPCKNRLAELCEAEDIGRYLYACLLYKQCCVCGKRGDQKALHFHHCGESRVGMGRQSTDIPLVGLQGMALCWEHHDEIHMDAEQVFFEKYHVYPIRIDQKIAEQYKNYRQSEERK